MSMNEILSEYYDSALVWLISKRIIPYVGGHVGDCSFIDRLQN